MEVKVITPPVELPVTLDEVKNYIKVDFTDDDDLINRLIKAVTMYAQLYTGLSFITQTLDIYFTNTGCNELPYGPHQSIVAVSRVNYDGTEVILTDEEYSYSGFLYYSLHCGYSFKLSSPWYDVNKMRATVIAGFGDASQVPDGIKVAILKEVAELYENRENTVIGTIIADLSSTTKDYLYQYKRNVFV
jgi:uncharacterized phiE125 gp8 family phage protein